MRGDQWKRLLEVGRVDLLPDGWLKVETHKDLIKLIDGHAKINLITNIAEILWWECATLYAVMRLEKPTTIRICALYLVHFVCHQNEYSIGMRNQ